MKEINIETAMELLRIVDQGLTCGIGVPKPGQMCVEAAVCYVFGLPHSDNPECVAEAVRRFKIRLNDHAWSSNEARAKGLRRLAVAQLGSKGVVDNAEFAKRIAAKTIRVLVPLALRAAALGSPGVALLDEIEAIAC